MSDRVRITDVSPRDGLQNEPGVISTADKVRLVELLCASGVDEIEVTSFVSPKWVPQLGDADAVLRGVAGLNHETHAAVFSVLVPNDKGMDALQAVNGRSLLVEKFAVFTAASEAFSQKNTNATIDETLARFRTIMDRNTSACGGPLAVRGYISCAIACPFSGPIDPHQVAVVAHKLAQLGVDEIDLGDTIGAGTPATVTAMIKAVMARLGPAWASGPKVTLHLHDTFGQATECVKAALDVGIRSFDGAVGGLGGCPYASTRSADGTTKRAPGNISTETLVQTVHAAGFKTGVSLPALTTAADFARDLVGRARADSIGGANR